MRVIMPFEHPEKMLHLEETIVAQACAEQYTCTAPVQTVHARQAIVAMSVLPWQACSIHRPIFLGFDMLDDCRSTN